MSPCIRDGSGNIPKISIQLHPCLTSLPPLEQFPLLVGESDSALEEEAILLFLVAGSSAEGEAAAAVAAAVAAVGAAVGAVEATTPDSALDI